MGHCVRIVVYTCTVSFKYTYSLSSIWETTEIIIIFPNILYYVNRKKDIFFRLPGHKSLLYVFNTVILIIGIVTSLLPLMSVCWLVGRSVIIIIIIIIISSSSICT